MKYISIWILYICFMSKSVIRASVNQSEIANTNNRLDLKMSSSIGRVKRNLESINLFDQQEKRQTVMLKFCSNSNFSNKTMDEHMIYTDKESLLYCYIPKAACTTWKRMFQIFDGKMDLNQVMAVEKNAVHKLHYNNFTTLDAAQKVFREKNYYSFLVSRHPFERLLSAYRNKFLDPYTTHYQKKYGAEILRLYRNDLTEEQYLKGEGVTFREFIKYVISGKPFDKHWRPMTQLCSPCRFKYRYLGKMETLFEDATAILKNAGISQKFLFLSNSRDRYKPISTIDMKSQYMSLKASEIRKLYYMYKDDFLAFGYTVPYYIEELLATIDNI
ncbi:carbohydrate sulfotransferase 11 [Hydra vulgaris]|uniref:carbohydrate sulfotransferase 11 n=1 Tax=Hydra vulgaris TaxID=6087 RepID=UPI0001925A62|nr:carbohydrate sulfotransferase 11 [Hydra vulgaris]XP_047128496.1 carbohydrate sulfotransferase 11 [Hydra vulgaris]XP_047128498.1 carbohydrate sulfotransferase 11 [Hydra vulgaris]XP_047128499.1 carbohydrate sulfotransferase 11 [Hydra vulgaris]XP_047128500.1 carbohydrate sulfotransferase 11 [Hydra vulgaris]XP_047128501.1 carbohydrate sulfotransferase 11 [Hydra vulgaris]XP_047128502.1 carbohydrate sulfotransferase 11 [Hydra vulgaris]XP_047128503.1 carbohydrate sulfotransferase 11 [Hydra vulga